MSRLEDLRSEIEWRRCAGTGPSDLRACLHFLRTYWKIRHPEKGRIPFELRDAQEDTLRDFFGHRYTIILKARQVGFTTLSAAYAFWLAFFHSDKNILALSRTEREAIYLLGMTKYGYASLPPWLKDRGPTALTDHLQKLRFDNDSQIESLPSQKDPARGMTAYLVIVDEWASLENPEEAWASIEPVADVGGRVIGLSTAKGWGDFFHGMWLGAVTGTNRFHPIFHSWRANTDRGDSWYEGKKDDFAATPWILAQEYPNDPDEAFIKSGMNVFDVDFIQVLEAEVKPPMRAEMIDLGGTWETREAERGPLSLWEWPDPLGTYVVGADVAQGLEHGDFSSAHILDYRSGALVAHWHGHVRPEVFAEVLLRLGRWYNTALLGVENNNHGLTTCTELLRHRYTNLYFTTSLGTATQKAGKKVGWSTTVATKPILIDDLAKALHQRRIAVWDSSTLAELKTYVREPDGRTMHGSPHDDRVISLGLAVQMLGQTFAPEYAPTSNDFWTMDWWARQLDEAEDDRAGLIGQR